MPLSSALRKAFGPSLLALMTAFAPAANAADAATMKYDPARGVIDGDKYTREEASKFVCLVSVQKLIESKEGVMIQ